MAPCTKGTIGTCCAGGAKMGTIPTQRRQLLPTYLALQDKNDSDDNYGRINFGSAHTTGSMFVMCDGSVQIIPYTVDAGVHWRLSNRRDGLTVRLP